VRRLSDDPTSRFEARIREASKVFHNVVKLIEMIVSFVITNFRLPIRANVSFVFKKTQKKYSI